MAKSNSNSFRRVVLARLAQSLPHLSSSNLVCGLLLLRCRILVHISPRRQGRRPPRPQRWEGISGQRREAGEEEPRVRRPDGGGAMTRAAGAGC